VQSLPHDLEGPMPIAETLEVPTAHPKDNPKSCHPRASGRE
jgi:hypothetical protein